MTTIQLMNPSELSVSLYGDSFNRVFLDVDNRFELRLTKSLGVISDTQQIRQEAALGDAIIATPKNRQLLESFRGDVIDRRTDPIKIQIEVNGERQPIGEMSIIGIDNVSGDFETDLFGDDWIDDLEKKLIKDVNLGTYQWSLANIQSSWSGDRQQLAMPLFADFGDWSTPTDVTRKDLRISFNLFLLMQKVFCEIGWTFECDHFSKGNGEYAYTYISPENWYSYRDKAEYKYVELNVDQHDDYLGPLDTTVVSDVSGAWSVVEQEYNRLPSNDPKIGLNIEYRNIQITLNEAQSGANSAFIIRTFKTTSSNTVIQLDAHSYSGSSDHEVSLDVSFDVYDENSRGGDSYHYTIQHIWYVPNQPAGGVLNFDVISGTILFRPDPKFYIDDDDIYLSDIIDPSYSGLDLLKALAHLMNGKLVTDYASRKVTMLPGDAYDAKRTGETIKGFFKRDGHNPIDLTAYSISDNHSWVNKENERKRFIEFGFEDSDDAISSANLDGTWNRTVDLGKGIQETEKKLNELFVNTIEVDVAASKVGGTGVKIPALLDNDNGDISVKIDPRVFIFYGKIDRVVDGSSQTWSFESVVQNTIPLFSQVALESLPIGVDFIPLSFKGYSDDLFELFYKKETQEFIEGIEYEFIISGGDMVYNLIDFRTPLLVRGTDANWTIQAISVQDHLVQSKLPFTVSAIMLKC